MSIASCRRRLIAPHWPGRSWLEMPARPRRRLRAFPDDSYWLGAGLGAGTEDFAGQRAACPISMACTCCRCSVRDHRGPVRRWIRRRCRCSTVGRPAPGIAGIARARRWGIAVRRRVREGGRRRVVRRLHAIGVPTSVCRSRRQFSWLPTTFLGVGLLRVRRLQSGAVLRRREARGAGRSCPLTAGAAPRPNARIDIRPPRLHLGNPTLARRWRP